uniref:Uncharacterized protein n=1 Tax=Schlesneria paludicola TaxID=360056 RepID=A0A7C2JYB5_9PLAN
MTGSGTPFPWWLWILAGLWAGGVVLRGLWTGGREGRWFLDVLVGVYTALLMYMAAQATVSPGDAVGLARVLTWNCGGLAIGGGLLCLLGTTPKWQTGGWIAATLGLAGLSLGLQAPVLAALCVVAAIVGATRRGDLPAEHHQRARDPWLVVVLGTMVCVAWLGAVQFAARVESQRESVSQRYTVLPAVKSDHEGPPATWSMTALLLAAAVVGLATAPSLGQRRAIRETEEPAP